MNSDTGETAVTGLTDDASSARSIRTVSIVGDISVAGRHAAAAAS